LTAISFDMSFSDLSHLTLSKQIRHSPRDVGEPPAASFWLIT
jgi:hypothetical protein